ncbi:MULTISPECIES: hypothetical protein [unclassified Pseudomonas]|uniref:hypothetical protein n=1 Tax=unclassified Pseudomonas TaxID=196821 RepID=UPI000A1F324B|nr:MULTISPECIES: hypothetical protein [unclassified Pseudomonas]
MTIDKQKLQSLLWSEVASWKADCAEWKRSTEALQEFLGEKTVEEVALELLAENERLTASPQHQIIRAAVTEAVKGIADAAAADTKAGTLKVIEQLKAENEALRKDAERYRWLRDGTAVGPNIQVAEWHGPHEYPMAGVELDSAIDAALSEAVRT